MFDLGNFLLESGVSLGLFYLLYWAASRQEDILSHEKEHIRKGHSMDMLLLGFLTIVQWFSPARRQTGHYCFQGGGSHAPEFEQEALRVVKTSPDWDPGKQRGENVAVEITLPIRFMLDGGEKKESAQVNEETEEPIFFVVEEMPTFSYKDSNNIGAFRTYIADQLVYPEEAKRKGVTGRIFVRFIVEPDGSVSGVDIVRGLETDKDELKSAVEALNREALRVVRESPPWIPGKQRGHNVRVAFTFPIIFMLTGKDEAGRYMESLDQKK